MSDIELKAVWAAALLAAIITGGCKQPEARLPAITDSFEDRFERDETGANYHNTGGDAYQLTNGALRARGGYNHPLWLRRRLPANAEIELDVWSQSSSGDIKVELYGDGKSFDPDRGSYMASGYVLVMGGWNNSKSIIAKRDEHGKELAERQGPAVIKSKRYHWKIVRVNDRIDWFVDDMTTPYLSYVDPAPLVGKHHAYFGFNDWEAEVFFDNLVIRAR